ncbi:MAG: lipopolysaccharide biosynthesis protein [Polaromonas sp.]
MTTHQLFVSGLRWVATGKLSSQLISWVGTIYVMRTLAPEDYGLAAICSAIIAVVSLVAEFGIGASIIQAKTLEREQLRSIFGASLIFFFTAAAAVVLAAPLLAWFFRAPASITLIQVSALHLVLAPLAAMPSALLRRDLRFRSTSVIEFTVAVSASLSTVALAWRGAGVWSVVLGPLVGALVSVLMLNLLAPQKLSPSFDLRPAKGMIGFGFTVALSRIANFVFGQSDFLIAGRTLTSSALGEYSVAMQLAMLPVSKAMGIVNQVIFPTISRMNHAGQNMRPLLLDSLRLAGYVIVPLLWGMAVISPWLIPALIGPQWKNVVLPLQIVCLVLPLRLISVLLSSVLQGMGLVRLELRNTMTGVILLPLCFLVGAQFGTPGLAFSWLVGLPLLVALNLRRAHQALGISLLDAMRALSKPLGCSALMVCSVGLMGYWSEPYLPSWATLVLMVVSGLFIYLSLLWRLDPASADKLLSLVRLQSESD